VDTDSLEGPLARFRDPSLGGLGPARVHKYWVLEAGAGAGLKVWARLENGAPLLLERRVGRGRSLLLTTTLDRDGADICLQPSFVPLLETVLLHAVDRLREPLVREALAGYPHHLPYDGTVEVAGPAGGTTTWSPGQAFVPPVPGTYRLLVEGEVLDAFSARLPPAESDLGRLTAAELDSRLGAGGYTVGDTVLGNVAGVEPGRDDLSAAVAAALLLFLVLEALLSTRWYRRPTRDILGEEPL
jgi:hypothetical protein